MIHVAVYQFLKGLLLFYTLPISGQETIWPSMDPLKCHSTSKATPNSMIDAKVCRFSKHLLSKWVGIGLKFSQAILKYKGKLPKVWHWRMEKNLLLQSQLVFHIQSNLVIVSWDCLEARVSQPHLDMRLAIPFLSRLREQQLWPLQLSVQTLRENQSHFINGWWRDREKLI